MCRHLAYLGPPRPLAALIVDAPHGLLRQSYAPRDMRGGGSVNADGFGLGWYQPGVDAPLRYRRDCPIWTDAALPALAAATVSGAALCAVRNATTGMPTMETAAAPFTEGRFLFSHNGRITGWPDSVAGLAGTLPTRDLLTLDAPTDAALLWALVRHRLRTGASTVDAVAETVFAVEAAAPGSRLNVLLTDGTAVVATAWTHSLSYLRRDGAVLLASEPLDDDPGWRPVPDRHLVAATTGAVDLTDLSGRTITA
ncbi:gamma-glutamyl-hercynylcysteine sulfoxide hydrolase [Virgisporangium aliadipatigenens]|uniref:Gamma-glutamyl-hercynylcysteine sulfoxide hydrolase n=1 Tax=Virgisporangium aliadipatigenens TaxID=741659 RepID=A0A8J4DN46_9ACTN|nr:ergothioneine biosynthesis protein EgtC [Virgisporangium aliadipatigenens]GIJ44485.1 gamma-glutamyl-hercynylcysteine sulfoxide hydrolase [Virgisporangium aliadipatigenens]